MSCLSLLPDNVAPSGGCKLKLLKPASFFHFKQAVNWLPAQAVHPGTFDWMHLLASLCFAKATKLFLSGVTSVKEKTNEHIRSISLTAILCLDAIICAKTTQLFPLNDCSAASPHNFRLLLAEHACLQLLRAAAPQPLIIIISVSSQSYWMLLRLNGLLHRKYCNSTAV